MRDPNRIDHVLGVVAAVWKRNPDLRLGQLIANVPERRDFSGVFGIEDDELIKGLMKVFLDD